MPGRDERIVDVAALIDARPMGRRQIAVVVLCGTIALLDGFDLQAIGLAAPAIATALRISPSVLGAVFSAALAGLALGAFVLGPVADRFGCKRVLVASTLCFGVFTVCTATATSLDALLVYRFLTGLGLGGAMPSFIALAAEYAPQRLRATVVSLLYAGFPLGGVVGGVLGARLIPSVGWPALFYAGGLLPILLTPLLLGLLPESPGYLLRSAVPTERLVRLLRRMYPTLALAPDTRFAVPEAGYRAIPLRALFGADRAFRTAMLWIGFFIAFMLLVTNTAWSPILLLAAGIEVARSGLAMAAFNLGSVAGTSLAGWSITRFGAAFVLPASFVGAAGALVAVGQGAPSATAVTIAQAGVGVFLGAGSSGLIALAALLYPTEMRATGIGWAMAVGRFGSFIGPLIVGALVSAHLTIGAVFLALGTAALLAALPCATTRTGFGAPIAETLVPKPTRWSA